MQLAERLGLGLLPLPSEEKGTKRSLCRQRTEFGDERRDPWNARVSPVENLVTNDCAIEWRGCEVRLADCLARRVTQLRRTKIPRQNTLSSAQASPQGREFIPALTAQGYWAQLVLVCRANAFERVMRTIFSKISKVNSIVEFWR
jgi:hypothetical protein